jgi:glutamyl-Q tRNA(Asp) synthetase
VLWGGAVLGYCGRFAPSPTGPLHAGSLVAALASWLDARAHAGTWLVRIEDIDPPRCIPGADAHILRQLARCGLVPDAPVQWQFPRHAFYQTALDQLRARGCVYPCACTRSDIAQALLAAGAPPQRHAELVYPGTCRSGLHGRAARCWRLRTQNLHDQPLHIPWLDRRLGPQTQNISRDVGDFVVQRADGLWAYQLAVVVDDAAQGITDVVRGEDLTDNTARQIHLQRQLGLPTPRYLHTPLVSGPDGHKLSKQNGATALDLEPPIDAVQTALSILGLQAAASTLSEMLAQAVLQWRDHYPSAP